MKKIEFLDVKFYEIKDNEIEGILNEGGLFCFPSGPALSSIDKNPIYHNSLIEADYNFFDSGYFVLLLRFLKNIKVKKYSGYKFIYNFLNLIKLKKINHIFLIEPNIDIANTNKSYFNKISSIKLENYIAPYYDVSNINEENLINLLEKNKPKFIMINLGGGVQEVLGSYLKKKLSYVPAIMCTGAAMSFFTKKQAPINTFFDKLFLGWLIRIIFNPKIFFMRYFLGFGLLKHVLMNKIKFN